MHNRQFSARRAGSQVVTNVVCFRSQPDPLGIVLWYSKLEFVGRAGSQVVTNVVCDRFHPDPLGIVLWYSKLEFGASSERVIPNQRTGFSGNLHQIFE